MSKLIMFFRKKTFIIIIASMAVVVSVGHFAGEYYRNRDVQFRTSGTVFQIYKDGKWQDFLVKGVNIGASIPGCFPGDMGTEKEVYARWFKEIAAMNANAIRVYTILGPNFYDALFEYNVSAEKPLYLFQGVWNNEDAIAKFQNAYSPEITDEFKSE
ncbi:MAG: hypothetical protein FWF22_03715, partial [Treponema sp.]|nr:hypothetical protein [Treponema sp.]